jgi:hypothetical protein
MNYLQEKKQILELKLNLTIILMDKTECIRNQQYEKASDLRMKEKELLQRLDNKNQELMSLQNNFETKNHSTEDYFQLTSLINEISIHYTPFKHHEETIEDFFSVLKKDYNHLIQLKNDLIKEHKFKESSEIQNQILGIGRFLEEKKDIGS